MCSNNGEKDAKQHSENKWYNHRPTKLTIAIAGLITYGFFVFMDAHEFWPRSPLSAVSIGIPVTVAVLYLEVFVTTAISFPAFLASSAVIIIGGVLIYFFAPRDHMPDKEVRGTIQPGAAPQTDCEKKVLAASASADTVNVLLGDFGASIPQIKFLQVLSVGNCSVLWVTKATDSLAINADLYDSAGKLVARMRDNNFTAVEGEHSTIDRNGDLTQFVVKSGAGIELLHVEFLNRNTVRFRGRFGCTDHAPVVISDDQPISPTPGQTVCLIANGPVFYRRGIISFR